MPRKNEAPTKKEPKQKVVTRLPSEGLASVYSNNVQIGYSNWDVRFDFGEIQSGDAGTLVVAARTRVIMSPQHAAAFAKVLSEKMAEYEQLFGKQRWEPAAQPEAEK